MIVVTRKAHLWLLFFLFAASAAFFLKDIFLKAAVINAATKLTGAPIAIDFFSVDLFKHSAHARGLRMGNPPGFPRGRLLKISQISADYDPASLFRGGLHLYNVWVVLEELVVIRNKEGKLNVDALKVAQEKEQPSETMPMQIDTLKLRIGKVVYKDFGLGVKPSVEAYDFGMKEYTYQHIPSADQLAALVLAESMRRAAIQGALIYGTAAVAGVSFLPAGIAVMTIGKDDAEEEVKADLGEVYRASLDVLRELGDIIEENHEAGYLKAIVQGSNVTVRFWRNETAHINVSARKYFMPNQKIAAGVLYEIIKKLT